MKVKNTVLMMVLSMYTVNMFSMLLDLDNAHHYQWMAEQQTDSNETFAEEHNEVNRDVNEEEDGEQHSVEPEEEERTPQPFLMGWEWLQLSEWK